MGGTRSTQIIGRALFRISGFGAMEIRSRGITSGIFGNLPRSVLVLRISGAEAGVPSSGRDTRRIRKAAEFKSRKTRTAGRVSAERRVLPSFRRSEGMLAEFPVRRILRQVR